MYDKKYILAVIVIILMCLVAYRYYFMSRIINGVWIASQEFKDSSGDSELIIVIEGGTFNKKISLTIGNGKDIVTDIGKLYVYPQLGLGIDKGSFSISCDLKSMEGASKIHIGLDNSLLIDGDKTYFEGIKL
jgi:hypothetical protein